MCILKKGESLAQQLDCIFFTKVLMMEIVKTGRCKMNIVHQHIMLYVINQIQL
ncbi:hypothetical protein ACJX0J_028664, partial [Zea mays]